VSDNEPADLGTRQLSKQQSSVPNAQDCYACANLCMEMWNGSDDHAALSGLLRMADAWLRLAFELGQIESIRQKRNIPR
jgi:hypothetical protein